MEEKKCNCGCQHHHHEAAQTDKYEDVLSKYNCELNDYEITQKVRKLIEEHEQQPGTGFCNRGRLRVSLYL